MRIGLDARSISAKVCGVSRVTLRLVEALQSIDKDNQYFVFTDKALLEGIGSDNFKVLPTGFPRMNPFFDWKFLKIVAGLELDIFHSVHSWLPFNIGPIKAKKIVTIHDMFAVTDPEFFSRYRPFGGVARRYFSVLTERSAREADMILTVSKYSRKRIQEVIPAARGKVQVLYNASGLDPSMKPVEDTADAYGRYLLYVGNCRSYKNVPILIKGFSAYLRANRASDLFLVIAGNDFSPSVRELAEQCGVLSKIKFLTNPDDIHLRNLYSGALAFIMPSKEEGFGIPVLEAMGMGLPVIISDAEALLEVAGGAALVFPKDDFNRLAALIQQVSVDSNLRADLRTRGIARNAAFSWKRSASELKSCYEKCFNEVI